MDKIADKYWIEPNTGCWIWSASLDSKGYAQIKRQGKIHRVHRYVYERTCGPVAPGLVLDHLCRVKCCINPAHLEPVTQRENMMRAPTSRIAVNAAKTHCPKGHEYSPENTGRNCVSGGRFCKACKRVDDARRSAAARLHRTSVQSA